MVEDIDFVPVGVKILVKRSKTDQSGEGMTKGIPYFSNSDYCPEISLKNWLEKSDIKSGKIIDISDKSNPTTLVSHFAGIDGISTHDVAVTEDENYLFTGDENLGGHIKSWNITDYNNIIGPSRPNPDVIDENKWMLIMLLGSYAGKDEPNGNYILNYSENEI